MTQASVSVRRLRVTATASLASRIGFAARLEDALRTSSPPAAWKGRLVLIRRLRLRAGERWPAHLLARNIEAAWHADTAQAVPGERAGPDAQAVWFADESGARLALIERLARGRDASAWFWQRWLPSEVNVENQIAQLLVASGNEGLANEERVRYFADACRAIGDLTLIDRVIDCCDHAQLRWMLSESRLRARVIDGADDSGPADSRAAAGIEHRVEPASWERSKLREFARWLARSTLGTRPPGAVSLEVPASGPHAVDSRNGTSRAPVAEGVFTEWAGLFFALNLFRLLKRPDPVVSWLRDIAAFVRVAADDPLLAVLDRLDPRGAGQEGESQPGADLAPLRELRLACLRATRRPLRRVLHRAGVVHLNRTHLTIALRLAEVRLPVRIAGLDVDPGWVDSMQRVVSFEYD